MRTELVFFDTKYQSKRGLLRGVAALGFLTIFSFLWYGVAMKEFYTGTLDKVDPTNYWIGYALAAFMIISAIAVQLPKDAQTALLYGALLGAVVYGVSNGVLMMVSNKWTLGTATVDLSWGVISTMMISFLIYKIFF